MMQAQMNSKGYPVVERTDYTPPHGEPGYDGFPIEKLPARDLQGRDPLTGRLVREVPKGEENVNNSRVSKLLERKLLTRRQFDGAMMYYRDWYASLIVSPASAAPIRVDGGMAHSTLTDAKLDAQARHVRARKWLTREYDGRFLAVVEKVVLDEKIVELAASELRVHHQRAAAWLECGCDALGDHYGLAW